jgi:hypothetical protein
MSINIKYIVNSYLISLLKLKEPFMIKQSQTNNKIKTICDVVNSESGRNNEGKDILEINIDEK